MNLFWFQDQTVNSSLPLESTSADIDKKKTEVLVALSLSVTFNVIELISLFVGMTIFSHGTGLFSITCHITGSITLAFVLLESLSVTTLWYSFAFTSVLPAVLELFSVMMISRLQGS